MSSQAALPVTFETRVGEIGQISLTGPYVGALLLGSIVFVNEANFRLGNVHQFNFDWQIALRLIVCALCGLYGLAHLSTTRDTLMRFPAAWCLLFAGWALVTVVFAVDTFYSAAAAGCLWCIVLFAPAVLQQLGGRKVVLTVLASLSAYMIASWFVYFAFGSLGRTPFVLPSLEVVYRLGGLNHANSTGRQAALGLALLMALGAERVFPWRRLLFPFAGFALTLFYTGSRTSMMAAGMVALLGIRYLSSTARARLIVFGPILAVVLGLGMMATNVNPERFLSVFSRSGDMEELYGMSGRSYVWQFVLGKIEESPFTGWGYGCSRFAMPEFNELAEQDVAGYHAHNLILNVALGAGVLAGVLLCAALLSQAIALLASPSFVPDAILILILVGGIADAVMLNPIPDSHTVMWLVALFWRQTGATLTEASGLSHAEVAIS